MLHDLQHRTLYRIHQLTTDHNTVNQVVVAFESFRSDDQRPPAQPFCTQRKYMVCPHENEEMTRTT